MKQYKLKKHYPSLPKDWEEGMLVGQGDRKCGLYYSPCNGKYKDIRVYYTEVENNSEYWEKVVEKDYEILSFMHYYTEGDMGIAHVQQDGSYLHNNIMTDKKGTDLDWMLKSESYVIHSIKRLSDGEIFTVGDMILRNGHTVKLEKIEINTTFWGDVAINDGIEPYGAECLRTLRKAKKPLFTTEDGIDIFEGSKYYTVYTMSDDKGTYNTWKTQNVPFIAKGKTKDFVFKDVVYFSTKEAAQAYIENNSKLFSATDIHELLKKHSRFMIDSSVYLELSEMVKERLK